MIKAVLFDIDGTLADSNDLHVRAWGEVFRKHGLHVCDDAIHAQIGKGADLLVPALVRGADEKLAKALGEEHGAIFKSKYLATVKPFPGARDLLARTKAAGRRVVLASSASKEELDHYVDLLGAREIVEAGTSIDDVKTSKPAPDIFSVALKKAGAKAGETIAVGDSPYDAEAAGKSGIVTVGLRSGGFSDEVLRGAGAKAIYDDAATLLSGFEASPLAW
jgi:HAD superfamily hydrolase (TIGR01509 family)